MNKLPHGPNCKCCQCPPALSTYRYTTDTFISEAVAMESDGRGNWVVVRKCTSKRNKYKPIISRWPVSLWEDQVKKNARS